MALRKSDQFAEALRIAETARYWAQRYIEASQRLEDAAHQILADLDEAEKRSDDDA